MNCCVNCFLDSEIISIIRGQNTTGNCDFCGHLNTSIYDTNDNEHLLSDLLYGLLSIYSTSDSLPNHFPAEKKDFLRNILDRDWYIFNLESEKIHVLIKEICKDKYPDDPELFDSPVGLSQICDDDYLSTNSLLRGNSWDNFVNSIKTENRFHSNYINTDILGLLVGYAKATYRAGQLFYRARISTEPRGFSIGDMGPPPSRSAKAGRVNAEGISVLYLADSIDTVVYEVRAGRYDYITIGTFELLADIDVISLDSLKSISPFMRDGDIAQHAVNIPYLKRLSHEVARPLRRYDSALDYLPTQYISDFIKSQDGISGITFKSAMYEHGTNLAAFSPSLFQCNKVDVLEIEGLQYNWRIL